MENFVQNIQDTFKSQAFGPKPEKIDTHHHFVPDFYAKALEDAGGDPSGWPTPIWSVAASEAMMACLGIKTAILSLTAPGACILQGQASCDLARQCNEFCSSLKSRDPSKWGFFAALPSILDTEKALSEIAYALDVLGADGVTLFTRYGDGSTYLGHPSVEPIWAELNKRKAVVFIHPTHPVDTNKVNPKMPQPMIDYPHETTRTAMDMILSGMRKKYRDCKVILSHAGGALPYVINRVAMPLARRSDTSAQSKTGLTYDQVMSDFQSFHYDVALSGAPEVIRTLRNSVPADHILYGSDFPYAPLPGYPAFLQALESCDLDAESRDMIHHRSAARILPRLA